MQSVSCVSPAEMEAVAGVAPDAGDMLATLARTQKHVGQFVCEVDGAPGRKSSHLRLSRHGEAIAAVQVAVRKFPGLRGYAVVDGGPLWYRIAPNPDLTIYRALLGALVQEYCIRRGHRLMIVPCKGAAFDGQEMLALQSFGFVRRLGGSYAFRMPSPWRIMGAMSAVVHAVQRTIARATARA